MQRRTTNDSDQEIMKQGEEWDAGTGVYEKKDASYGSSKGTGEGSGRTGNLHGHPQAKHPDPSSLVCLACLVV